MRENHGPVRGAVAGCADTLCDYGQSSCCEEITDFGISVRHLDRLLGGLLLATAFAQAWSVAEVLRCWVKTAEP